MSEEDLIAGTPVKCDVGLYFAYSKSLSEVAKAYEIWRFMMDENHQNKGYGKEALQKAIEYLKTKPKGAAESCFLSYIITV